MNKFVYHLGFATQVSPVNETLTDPKLVERLSLHKELQMAVKLRTFAEVRRKQVFEVGTLGE